MMGLIDHTDRDFAKRLDNIRKQITDNQNNYKSADLTTKETYTLINNNLVQGQVVDNNFDTVSGDLRKRIEELKQSVTRNVNKIINIRTSIENQLVDIKRLEVDIDIKIRACKGSCSQGYNYNVDKESYVTLQKSLQQAKAINLDPSISQTNSLRVMKMRPVKDTLVAEHYKSLPQTGADTQFILFPDVQQKAMVLERQGTVESVVSGPSGSIITATKVDSRLPKGTGKVTVTGTGTGTGIGVEKQIFTGGEEKSTTTVTSHGRTVKCTKTITTKVIQGPHGPREEQVETVTGGEGDECAHLMTKLGTESTHGGTYNVRVTSDGGLSDITKLPSFEDFLSGGAGSTFHSSSSSSSKRFPVPGSSASSDSSITKVVHVGHDVFSNLGEDGIDDFSSIHLGTPSFPGESSSYSKTVVSSSSSSSSKSSPFDTKTMKSGYLPEDLVAVQHDQPDSVTWKDCDDIHQKHVSGAKSGIFRIRPEGSNKVLSVYCDQDTVLGGWLLIQQREDGSVNFNRTWHDYKTGFGNLDAHGKGEMWLGNEYIHLLTQKDTVLRVELEDWSGKEAYAEYSIQVRPESEGYALRVSQYVGTTGDALIQGSPEDEEYTFHNRMKFSTLDRDSDLWEENCAEVYGGGWWYNNCQAANLNGMYYIGGQYDPRNNVPYEIENGVVWALFRPADYSLRSVRMKIRPRNAH
nr:fibrinogen alpha chain isoform X2 [Geotrypetes seraphini]